MLAGAAATIVVHHDPSADPGGALLDLAPHGRDYAAWFVAGDHRPFELAQAERSGFPAARAIELEIAAAHAGRLDFDDDIVRPGRRVGKVRNLQFALTEKSHATHEKPLPNWQFSTLNLDRASSKSHAGSKTLIHRPLDR
jgi:hypothetical protein